MPFLVRLRWGPEVPAAGPVGVLEAHPEAPGLQVSAWLPVDRVHRPVDYRRRIPE